MDCLARVQVPPGATFFVLECESRNIPRYTQRAKGGGLRGVDHEMFQDLLAVVLMHISEPQSRTVPMYIAFWQLHSLLYLEKSRDIWDSVPYP